jgi:hypothetical protein
MPAGTFTVTQFHLITTGKHHRILPNLLAVDVSSLRFQDSKKLAEALILLGEIRSGAGEGNRTLVSIPQGGHAKTTTKAKYSNLVDTTKC